MTIKVLIIDDDKSLCARLEAYFAQHDLQLIIANSATEGLSELTLAQPDVLLLDVMMPQTDGFTLCKQIRLTNSIPIIMLTARGELSDKVLGLELGADDYLAKPFEPRELVARVQVLVRRQTLVGKVSPSLSFGELQISTSNHQATLKGEDIGLTGMEFKLLHLLASHPGEVFSRDQLLNELKGIDAEIYSRSIDILMSRLRQKLGDDPKHVKFIKTLRNVGYTFIGKSA
ncbi:two-component system, OmpR family, response regulator RpaB [Arsukibacterium tuosuense]|uniref:Two-component system, OmpR family, response regulator RpaB n=1 Tax=Arsukibacterium tuosuense TaxID=1323745 RepID=A0A285ITZ0_9GAMM|nr:response regulator transcription factor [Arsukibacterium tuosuense]SNY51293.1 two-component system, OmpR family, response regulator RpaB [Arsukibacterium tuosuense]